MMLVTGPHQCLSSTLNKILNGAEDIWNVTRSDKKVQTMDLFDFGAKIRLIVETSSNGRPNVQLKIRFRKGYEIHDEGIDYLRNLYGPSISFRHDEERDALTLSVAVNDALGRFESPRACIDNLAQIRIHTAGAPIFKALHRLTGENDVSIEDSFLYKLGSHGKCGSYHCISTKEK